MEPTDNALILSVEVLNLVLYDYLEPKDIISCILACKDFNVLTDYQMEVIKGLHMGIKWCVNNKNISALLRMTDNEELYIEMENIILGYAKSNKFDEVKFLWRVIKKDVKIGLYSYLLTIGCSFGELGTVKWLWEQGNKLEVNNSKEVTDGFRTACMQGHIDVVKWLWEANGGFICGMNNIFNETCRIKYNEISKWLALKCIEMNISIDIQNPDVITTDDYNHIISEIESEWCNDIKTGNLDRLKKREFLIVNDVPFIDIDKSFFLGCKFGYLDVIEWLWDISGGLINIHFRNDRAFRHACGRGNLDTVKWLWKTSLVINSPIDIHNEEDEDYKEDDYEFGYDYIFIDDPFYSSCVNGNIEIAEWLLNLGEEIGKPIDIHKDNEYVFVECFDENNLEVAQWLWDYSNKINSPIDIHAEEDRAFRLACFRKQYGMIKWLWDLSKEIRSPIILSSEKISSMNEFSNYLRKNNLLEFLNELGLGI